MSLLSKLFGGGSSSSSSAAPSSPAPTPSTSANANNPTSPMKINLERPKTTENATTWTVDSSLFDGGSEVARAVISLYLQPPGCDIIKTKDIALLLLIKLKPFTYVMKILSKEKVMLSLVILPSLTFFFKPAQHSLIGNFMSTGAVHAFHAVFCFDAEEAAVRNYWNMAYLEVARQEEFKKACDNAEWMMSASDDKMDVDDDDESKDDSDYDFVESSNKLSLDDAYDGAPSNIRASSAQLAAGPRSSELPQARNQNLAVGIAVNRTFVNRGPQLGVFKHDSDGSLEYLTRIPAVATLDGSSFSPTKMMLHEGDTKMLFLNPHNKSSVYEMDIERGQIIQEYGAGDDWAIRNFGPASKYAERSTEATIMGVNNNAVFSLDPRQHGKNKLAQNFTYQAPTKFSCVATNEAGEVAVGSDKGDIRLFDSISKRAKSLLPGLGDPIIGMDVTAKGDYILATTPYYLLVIPTHVEGQVKSGFRQSIANTAGAPIKLQLQPADMVRFNLPKLAFTAAHFNTGEKDEEWIVTSTGPYIVTWNFNSIKKGNRFDYKVKRCDSEVVADQFIFDHQDQMVVTLPDHVYMEHRNMKK